jgi:hypothetical protein
LDPFTIPLEVQSTKQPMIWARAKEKTSLDACQLDYMLALLECKHILAKADASIGIP